MRGPQIKYSEAELAWIKANCTLPRKQAHRRFVKKFNRPDISFDNYKGLCARRRWKTGRDGRFSKGQESWNRGKKMPFNANSVRTQFKKGHAPHNTKYAGHERICAKDGYVYISINETNPHTGFERRYVCKHKWLWEQINGPVPEDQVLKCLDGNRQNTDPENWIAIPRELLPRLSGSWGVGYDSASENLKPTIMATAKLKHALNTARKGELIK